MTEAQRPAGKLARAFLAFLAIAALVLALSGCGGSGAQDAESSEETAAASAGASTASSEESAASAGASTASSEASDEDLGYTTTASGKFASGTHTATVKVKGYDAFEIELDADAAPVSVANFAQLSNDKYYDGLAFYRVVDGFCLQGGTKGNTASGNDSSLTPIVGEFSGNDVDNPLADDFGKGTVAMARTSDPNSATSTFFITLSSSSSVSASLNGQYAAFGTIGKAGMKVVGQIVDDCKDAEADSMGVISSEKDMPVIKSIRVK